MVGPEPGERMPPIDGQLPIGTGDEPRFALFAKRSEGAARLLRDYPKLLEPGLRPPVSADGAWLVRPDGYTACVAKSADVAPIDEYLRAMI